MAGTRQATDVILANGRKHLSRAEEAERRKHEVKAPPAQRAKPPKWLPEALKKEFRALGKKLIEAGLYSDLDADTLGRYLIAQHEYLIATDEVQKALTRVPGSGRDQEGAESWGRIQERYFKQARNCANDMGLTMTSRCRLVVPESSQKQEPENPFLQLIERGDVKYG